VETGHTKTPRFQMGAFETGATVASGHYLRKYSYVEYLSFEIIGETYIKTNM